MRIVHMHKYFHDRDGASRYERGLMRLQEHAGHSVAPFAMHDERNVFTPWSKYFVSAEDTSRVHFGMRGVAQFGRALWSVEARRRAEELCDVMRPDILHIHNIYTQLSPSVLSVATRRGIPAVMTVHDYALVSANYSLWDGHAPMDVRHLGWWATTRTRAIKHSYLATGALEAIRALHTRLRLYDRAISFYLVSSSFVGGVLKGAGIAQEKIIRLPLFSPVLLQGDVVLNAKKQTRTIVFAGRLEAYKGVNVLCDALRFLPSDVTVKIIGTGGDEASILQKVRTDARVEMVGFLPGDILWKEMASAAMVVVPSLWYEPFGLVALEAMTQGTPVIVANRGGLPEIVQRGGGVVVPAGDAKALGKAMTSLLEDDVRRDALGVQAASLAREQGNPQEHLAKILEVYSRCG